MCFVANLKERSSHVIVVDKCNLPLRELVTKMDNVSISFFFDHPSALLKLHGRNYASAKCLAKLVKSYFLIRSLSENYI